jgi:hypothetical protein
MLTGRGETRGNEDEVEDGDEDEDEDETGERELI